MEWVWEICPSPMQENQPNFGISKNMCSKLTLNINMVDSCPLPAVPDLFLKFLIIVFRERDMILFN